MDKTEEDSGVGVLDKAMTILSQLEVGPTSLSRPVATMHLARPTVYRPVIVLKHHRFVNRDMRGCFTLGPRFTELADATDDDQLLAIATLVLTALCDHTYESCQLLRRQADRQIHVAAVDRLIGLRDSVPVGALLSLRTGPSAQILLAWEEPERMHRAMHEAMFDVTQLSRV